MSKFVVRGHQAKPEVESEFWLDERFGSIKLMCTMGNETKTLASIAQSGIKISINAQGVGVECDAFGRMKLND